MKRNRLQPFFIAGGTAKFPLFALLHLPHFVRIVISGCHLCLLTGVLSPLSISAHGFESIMARLQVNDDEGSIELRLGIDYFGNPMIADEAAARAALQQALQVKHGGRLTRFTDLAPLSMESGSTWADSMPESLLPPDDGQPHQIMLGTWRWKADAPEIFFTVPRGNRHDVLLWQQAEEIESTMLLGGDVSPAIALSMPASFSAWWLIPIIVIALLTWRVSRQKRAIQRQSK
jgi:hypothetical protein